MNRLIRDSCAQKYRPPQHEKVILAETDHEICQLARSQNRLVDANPPFIPARVELTLYRPINGGKWCILPFPN